MFSAAIFETDFSCDKNIWIAAPDYCMYFYLIVLFPKASTDTGIPDAIITTAKEVLFS